MAAETDQQLLGSWHLASADPQLNMNDHVEMEFRPSGELIYAIDAGEKWQVMRLTYRVEGHHLVTNQPSSPREERTEFNLDDRGALTLDYSGAKCTFVRGKWSAPDV